jgi:outer membrane murein-binding lipoprotein Lpp
MPHPTGVCDRRCGNTCAVLSFFDEPEDFSPRRTEAAPRRSGGGPRRPDRDIVRRRQIFAIAIGVVVVILLFLLIKGCASIRKENAYKDYVREVAADVQQSQQESDAVFGLLRKGQSNGQSAVDMQNNINGFRAEAARLADRAKSRSVPGELSKYNRYLVDTLELRSDGLASIARILPTALGDQGAGNAIKQIAAQNRLFDASDVLFTQRYLPGLFRTIKDQGLENDVPVPDALRQPKGFLPSIDWLRPNSVAADLTGTASTDQSAATPGLHGTGLVSVTVQPSGKVLSTSGTTDIPAQKGLSFDVQVQNQGQNDEKNVTVQVRITGAGKPISVDQQIASIAQGATATASVPLPSLPQTGRPVSITVTVKGVPGEKKLDNNKQTYQAIFTAS